MKGIEIKAVIAIITKCSGKTNLINIDYIYMYPHNAIIVRLLYFIFL